MFEPYYKEVSKPIPKCKFYTGHKEELPIREQIAKDIAELKKLSAALESRNETYPHADHVFT